MLSFTCDYLEGAHPAILERLAATNLISQPGYGEDEYCASARQKIRTVCGAPDADVTFLVGGTQTNQTVIASLLRPYEGVVACETGHIGVHESGAIEATGHKVITLPQHNGKLDAGDLAAYLRDFWANDTCEHMVLPGMVYLSHPTEYGTLYTLAELTALSDVCRSYRIPLYVDGARLGYGLMSDGTDVTLADLVRLCDVFYIGGTKVGALCGEAVVFPRHGMPAHFTASVKQHGALLAKGRLLGVQFDTLFTDDLYFRISRHAIELANRLKSIFREKGYTFYLDSPTNQQFILLPDDKMQELSREVTFSFWEKPDPDHTVVRFATSWATREEDIDALEQLL